MLTRPPQPALDLALVVEGAPSMDIRAGIFDELERLLAQTGVFRSLSRRTLWLSADAVQLESRDGWTQPPRRLIDPSGDGSCYSPRTGGAKSGTQRPHGTCSALDARQCRPRFSRCCHSTTERRPRRATSRPKGRADQDPACRQTKLRPSAPCQATLSGREQAQAVSSSPPHAPGAAASQKTRCARNPRCSKWEVGTQRSRVRFREQNGSGDTLSLVVRSGHRGGLDAAEVQERSTAAVSSTCALGSHRGNPPVKPSVLHC